MIEIDGKAYFFLRRVYELRTDGFVYDRQFDTVDEAKEFREERYPGENFPPIRVRFLEVKPDEETAIVARLRDERSP
jgi:hypothetical protein